MARPATTRQAVLALLEEHGPLSIRALADMLGIERASVNSAISPAHKQKLVHIVGWKRSIGTRGNLGAIYAIGPGQDRKRPRFDSHKQAAERYREKYREVIRRREHAQRGSPVDPWLAILEKM